MADKTKKAETTSADPAQLRTIEDLAGELATPAWLFAATRALKGWAIGQQVTREAYEAATNEAANVQIGYPNRFE